MEKPNKPYLKEFRKKQFTFIIYPSNG